MHQCAPQPSFEQVGNLAAYVYRISGYSAQSLPAWQFSPPHPQYGTSSHVGGVGGLLWNASLSRRVALDHSPEWYSALAPGALGVPRWCQQCTLWVLWLSGGTWVV